MGSVFLGHPALTLDVSQNRPFETQMQNLWTQWMADGKVKLITKGNFNRPFVSCVKIAWDMISQEMLQKLFLKCCISKKLDGSEDDYVRQEDSNELITTKNKNSDEVSESGNEDQDEKMSDDDNVKYKLEDWKYLFGESEDEGAVRVNLNYSETRFNCWKFIKVKHNNNDFYFRLFSSASF